MRMYRGQSNIIHTAIHTYIHTSTHIALNNNSIATLMSYGNEETRANERERKKENNPSLHTHSLVANWPLQVAYFFPFQFEMETYTHINTHAYTCVWSMNTIPNRMSVCLWKLFVNLLKCQNKYNCYGAEIAGNNRNRDAHTQSHNHTQTHAYARVFIFWRTFSWFPIACAFLPRVLSYFSLCVPSLASSFPLWFESTPTQKHTHTHRCACVSTPSRLHYMIIFRLCGVRSLVIIFLIVCGVHKLLQRYIFMQKLNQPISTFFARYTNVSYMYVWVET